MPLSKAQKTAESPWGKDYSSEPWAGWCPYHTELKYWQAGCLGSISHLQKTYSWLHQPIPDLTVYPFPCVWLFKLLGDQLQVLHTIYNDGMISVAQEKNSIIDLACAALSPMDSVSSPSCPYGKKVSHLNTIQSHLHMPCLIDFHKQISSLEPIRASQRRDIRGPRQSWLPQGWKSLS